MSIKRPPCPSTSLKFFLHLHPDLDPLFNFQLFLTFFLQQQQRHQQQQQVRQSGISLLSPPAGAGGIWSLSDFEQDTGRRVRGEEGWEEGWTGGE